MPRLYAERIAALVATRHEVFRCDRNFSSLPRVDVLHVLGSGVALRRRRAIGPTLPLVLDLPEDDRACPPSQPPPHRVWSGLHRWQRESKGLALLRRADAVVVHAERMRAQIPHQRIVVVPVPAEPQRARERRQVRGRTLRVLFAERHAIHAGVGVLGEALRLLARRGARIEVHVAGADRWYLRAVTWWCMRGVPTRFAGELFDAEMDTSYRWADVVALPRDAGASSLVAQEALLRAVPVVGGDGSALEELLTEAGGGLLVRPSDSRGLADAICSIARDYPLWCRRAEEAARVLETSRSPAATLNALERAYELAIGHRSDG